MQGERLATLGQGRTDRDLGVVIEIFSGTPENRPQPDRPLGVPRLPAAPVLARGAVGAGYAFAYGA